MTRVVVWVAEGTWPACVDAAAALAPQDAEFLLVHVNDAELAEVLHGTYGGLFGRGGREGHDPGDAAERLAGSAAEELVRKAAERLGRPASTVVLTGDIEREVVAACADAALLVCARDGASDRLGPKSLGRRTRFVVDHAPCAVLLVWPGRVPGVDSIPPKPHRH